MPIIINSKNVRAITQSVYEKKREKEQKKLENRAKYNFHQFINYAIHVQYVVQCEVAIILVDNGNSWMEDVFCCASCIYTDMCMAKEKNCCLMIFEAQFFSFLLAHSLRCLIACSMYTYVLMYLSHPFL